MLLTLVMVLSLCTNFAYAAGNATLTVKAGEITNGKVEVTVDLNNNPGIASLGFTLNYDNAKLVPETYEKFSILGFGNCVSNYDQGKAMDSYEFASYFFGGTSNSTANGTLLKITFLVKSGEWEETPLDIVVNSGEVADQNYNDVAVDLVNSSVGLPIIDYAFENATKTYNGSIQALTATGFKDASGKSLSGVAVSYENNENKDAGTYTIKAIAKKDGYRTVTKTAALTISPKELTITGLSANNKTYDGTTNATLVGGTLNGKIGTDDVSVTIPADATFVSANAASNVSVNIPNIKLDGSAKNNYTLKQPTGIKANITAASITVTADAKSKRVGTDDPELTYTYTGQLYGSDTFTGKLSRKSGESIGKYDITQGTLSLGTNYKITYNKAIFEIVDKTPQNITVSAVPAKTYGDTPFNVTVTPDAASGLNNFTFESSNTDVAEISNDGTITIKAAGKTNITVKQAGNEEYAAFVKTQELLVNKVEIVVTADAKSKRVGTDDPALTYQYTGSLVGEDSFTGELARQSGEAVGIYDIMQGTLALNNNYNIKYNKGIFEILDKTPQNIIVADIPEKTYGDSSFAVTVTPDAAANLSNFAYDSSDKNVATIDESGTVTIAGAGETIISITEAGNEDYAKTTITTKLTVNKKTLEIKVDDVTITYGDEVKTNITYDGFVSGEDKSVLTKDVTVSGYSEKPNAGEYDIVLSGAEAANYEIGYTNAKLVVNKRNITVTQLKVFDKAADDTADATINTSSLIFDGAILGDDVTIDFANAIARFANKEIGTDITVNITALALVGEHAGNYNLTSTEIATTASIKDIITASDIAAQITTLYVVKDAEMILLPTVPTGYKVTLKSSDNEDVVKNDGSISPVENDTQVGLIFTVTSVNDDTDFADTATINVTIPSSTKVKVVAIAEANGNVTGGGEYLRNTDVTITATPDNGYRFSGWYDGETVVSTNASYTFKAERDITLIAKFSRQTSSSGGGGRASSFTIKFDTNGGSKIENVKVTRNNTLTEPKTPTKDGFKFEGWYSDKELIKIYDFAAKVTSSFTLYAKWTEVEKKPEDDKPAVPEQKNQFSDVKENDWFYSNVKYVFENKLMNGVSEDKFAPNDTLTRAMLVTILYRYEGEPVMNNSASFTDVDVSAYYADAVIWAHENGIVMGITESEFAPDNNITREQIAAIIYRYAKYAGYDVSVGEKTDILSYNDASEISEYAVSAVRYTVGSGLIKGKSNSTLDPQDNATRAEIAAILQRFIEANN